MRYEQLSCDVFRAALRYIQLALQGLVPYQNVLKTLKTLLLEHVSAPETDAVRRDESF